MQTNAASPPVWALRWLALLVPVLLAVAESDGGSHAVSNLQAESRRIASLVEEADDSGQDEEGMRQKELEEEEGEEGEEEEEEDHSEEEEEEEELEKDLHLDDERRRTRKENEEETLDEEPGQENEAEGIAQVRDAPNEENKAKEEEKGEDGSAGRDMDEVFFLGIAGGEEDAQMPNARLLPNLVEDQEEGGQEEDHEQEEDDDPEDMKEENEVQEEMEKAEEPDEGEQEEEGRREEDDEEEGDREEERPRSPAEEEKEEEEARGGDVYESGSSSSEDDIQLHMEDRRMQWYTTSYRPRTSDPYDRYSTVPYYWASTSRRPRKKPPPGVRGVVPDDVAMRMQLLTEEAAIGMVIIYLLILGACIAWIICSVAFLCLYPAHVTNRRPAPTTIELLPGPVETKEFPLPLCECCCCCSDIHYCLHTAFCFECRIADTYAAAGMQDYWGTIVILLGLELLVLPAASWAARQILPGNMETEITLMIVKSLFWAYLLGNYRAKLRGKLGWSPQAHITDYAVWLPYIHYCALSQEARSIDMVSHTKVTCCFNLILEDDNQRGSPAVVGVPVDVRGS